MPALCAEDYRALAQTRLTVDIWDFIEGGSGAELTVAANCVAFDAVALRPRVLVDVSATSTACSVLGVDLHAPIGIAPVAYHQLFHPDGELASARGAGAAGSLLVVSMFASQTVEDIAAAASGPLWLQLYWLRDRAAMAQLATRARAAGYRALVLTVDVPRLGRRLRDMRNEFVIPSHVRAVNLDANVMASAHERVTGASSVAIHTDQVFDSSITWSDLAWLKDVSGLPLILKGILTAPDARLALEHGADAVIVSNHGGRQLDGAIPAVRALGEVTAAVSGAIPVLLDGGVRRGRDAFVALALGADAVLVGRAAVWALAADGSRGVEDVIRLIGDDLAHTMALAGTPTLADIGPHAVATPPLW